MIIEYNRPQTIEEALNLLARSEPVTYPLAGGSMLNQPTPESFAVVDLQSLDLDKIENGGNKIILGAMVTLQELLEQPDLPEALYVAIRHEATQNLRNIATVAGTLVSADGRSPFCTTMLAMDTELMALPGDERIGLGNLLPQRKEILKGRLITKVVLPINIRLAYEYVARTPADLPLVCVAIAHWSAGRTRVAVGGFGTSPTLALDGPEPSGASFAAASVFQSASDQWASAEYRNEVASVLAKRCLAQLLG